ncbi:MAG: type I 3-dehydroquinate dehydratase [Lachnospiraceae bacterium]|nr:type I 3-dehydroquinate dehydratase [Lachnospiraceae bacterium]
MGENIEDIRIKAQKIKESPADILELRADYYKGDINKDLSAAFLALRDIFTGEVIFTYRSAESGQYDKLSSDTVVQLLKDAAALKADYVDVESLLIKEEPKLIEEIRKDTKVILSEHVYTGTFTAESVYDRLETLSEYNADMVKYVIMPKTKNDVMQLMEGVIRFKEDCPEVHVISHAMGEIGTISRLSAELIGSEIAFAALDEKSAPGQIEVTMMKTCLDGIHEQLESEE